MGRKATFTPIKDSSKSLWYVSIPARLSPTGKRSREYFKTKKEAEKRSAALQKTEKHFSDVAQRVSPDLIRDAVELNDLALLYGFKGLRDAFTSLLISPSSERNPSWFFFVPVDRKRDDFHCCFQNNSENFSFPSE